MSKYTTELRWILEQALDDKKLAHDEANWPQTYGVLGLDDFPLYLEAHRPELCNKIIRRYYTREICAETAGRWRLFVRDAMHLIMPRYNQLYESEAQAKGFDIYVDRDNVTMQTDKGVSTNKTQSSSESSSSSESTDTNVYSDTPQSEMVPEQIKQMKYATSVTIDQSDGTASATGSTTGTGEGTYGNDMQRTEKGIFLPRATLIKLARETFINVDEEIVNDPELRQCFMTVW